ncbi:hypothetical protein ACOZE3_21140 [Streptomyces cinereoruber]|uniref:hypothetical protein n=1 Tax=Streptomyces cinereoruber TaxID=67260 RepID=UPI003BF6125E
MTAATDYLLTGPLRFAASLRHALRDAAGAFEGHLVRVAVPTLVIRGAGDTIASHAWIRRVARPIEEFAAVETEAGEAGRTEETGRAEEAGEKT